MTATAMPLPAEPAPGAAHYLRILVAETKSEFLKSLRMPSFVIPTLAFPVLFYALFGLAMNNRSTGPVSVSAYLIASYGTFGVLGASLFGLGAGIAVERGQGWLTVKRASPMPPTAYIIAKMVMTMAFGAIVVALLFALGATAGHVRMPLMTWVTLAVAMILGAIPFSALGCALGFAAGPNSAQAIVNLIYLPMSFASGLWLPLEMLPHFFQTIAPFLPPYHVARLALGVVGADSSPALPHILALAAFTVLFLGAAVFTYRRDEGRTYG